MPGFDKLLNRYVLECELESEAGLHIGTGVPSRTTDAPIIRMGNAPFIPGSSLRGVLRSGVERILATLRPEGKFCIALMPPADGCERELDAEELEAKSDANKLKLCETCRFFGSTAMAARLKVGEALFRKDFSREPVRRDGVGIDRDTETAKDLIKFDFEVLDGRCEFTFCLQLENAERSDFALLYILLKEATHGFDVGGKRSRGLGRVRVKGYSVSYFDPNQQYGLMEFLAGGLKKMPVRSFESLLKDEFLAYMNGGE